MTATETKQYMKTYRLNNAGRIRILKRNWNRRNVKKRSASWSKWMRKNREKWTAYKNEWVRNNPDRVAGYKLKFLSLHPDYSLFPTFMSLDSCPGYESNIMIDRITPLDELIMKEEGLL